MSDLSHGLGEQGEVITGLAGAWHDYGYENPPAPGCKTIPPLGERSAAAIRAGHSAIEAIDDLCRQLDGLRAQLVTGLREDEDVRMARLDAKYGPVRAGVCRDAG